MDDVLILGCGYLGRRLAALWQAEGRRVLATTRSAARAEELKAAGVVPLVCDLTDQTTLTALPRVETTIWCAAPARTAGTSLRTFYVGGLENVLAGLPAPDRFLYVSSTSVYGQCHGEEVDEDAVTEPAEESGRALLEAEELLRQRQPRALVLRFAGIYGPGRLLREQTLRAGEPLPGDPDGWLNLIHVDDGAAAVRVAAAKGRPGAIYNISDGRPVRRHAFFTRLAEVLGVPPPRFGPAPPAQAGRRIVNRRLRLELGMELRYPSFEEGLLQKRRKEEG